MVYLWLKDLLLGQQAALRSEQLRSTLAVHCSNGASLRVTRASSINPFVQIEMARVGAYPDLFSRLFPGASADGRRDRLGSPSEDAEQCESPDRSETPIDDIFALGWDQTKPMSPQSPSKTQQSAQPRAGSKIDHRPRSPMASPPVRCLPLWPALSLCHTFVCLRRPSSVVLAACLVLCIYD